MIYKLFVALCLFSFYSFASPGEVSSELVFKRVSSCGPSESYADVIDRLVSREMGLHNDFDLTMSKFFGLRNSVNVSLFSHFMCSVDRSMFTKAKRKQITENGIKKANEFVNRYNGFLAIGDKVGATGLWRKFFYCLARVESLGTGSNFSKDSDTHLGIYQFSSIRNGNIFPCVKLWNKRNTKCKISETSDNNYYRRLLLRDDQKFNLFCGVNKVVQNFYVQLSNGRSCVSLHSEDYQHFGPLLNTVGNNLEKLMVCAVGE